MADQAALQQKYAPVGQVISDFAEYGTKFDGIFMNGDKLVLKCEVPSKVIANRVWDAIKAVDPTYSDFEIQMQVTGGDDQPYTSKPGDSLSKIAKLFYGDGNKYEVIAKHNNKPDPNKLMVGENLSIPPLG